MHISTSRYPAAPINVATLLGPFRDFGSHHGAELFRRTRQWLKAADREPRTHILAHAKTPGMLADRPNKEIVAILRTPDFRERMESFCLLC